jgi:hypothetical protein
MIRASDIMNKAGIQLLDQDHIRWPLSELALWINEGVRSIVLAKPSASCVTVALPMTKGTRQGIPGSIDGKTTLQLVGINRNLRKAEPREGGRSIRTAARALLDAQEPNWHNPSYVPFRAEVRQVVFDENVPTEFYTYPGNDGTGLVEAAISALPPPVEAPAGADLAEMATWDLSVGIDEPYGAPLLDYVLCRCHQKDDTAADLAKATAHYQLFATAIGIKVQSEGSGNPNRRR